MKTLKIVNKSKIGILNRTSSVGGNNIGKSDCVIKIDLKKKILERTVDVN
jgi:hypothetical protein